MTALEVILAFLVVMGVISIPLTAIVTRTSSPIGQAIADRIRRKTERRFGPSPGSAASALPENNKPVATGAPEERDPAALIEQQQQNLQQMSTRLEFLERLIEKDHATDTSHTD
jgi:hypothetical protein